MSVSRRAGLRRLPLDVRYLLSTVRETTLPHASGSAFLFTPEIAMRLTFLLASAACALLAGSAHAQHEFHTVWGRHLGWGAGPGYHSYSQAEIHAWAAQGNPCASGCETCSTCAPSLAQTAPAPRESVQTPLFMAPQMATQYVPPARQYRPAAWPVKASPTPAPFAPTPHRLPTYQPQSQPQYAAPPQAASVAPQFANPPLAPPDVTVPYWARPSVPNYGGASAAPTRPWVAPTSNWVAYPR